MIAACRSCGASIQWAITEYGRKMPLDLDTHADGRVVVVGRAGSDPVVVTLGADTLERLAVVGVAELRRSHFQTCPNADAHRGRRAP